jgi:uncharacterized cupredoxin-like copper-binding protein
MPARRALVVASLLLLAVGAMAGCGGAAPVRLRITIHYSHFDPAALTVPHGVPVTFVLVNTDPIDHEWIVGDDALHQRHRTGTEPYHNARPTEVTIVALSTKTTTVTFATPGTLKYICHLPGHEAFGMVGTLTVT